MTVKDLIQELKKHDKDREIIFQTLDDVDCTYELTIERMEDSIHHCHYGTSRKIESIPCVRVYLG